MIYGAYGYTGRLVAALAAERGELPVLAGRDERRLRDLGELFELEHRAFDLSDPARPARRGLEGIDAVAHCAGPFSATSPPMVDACLATGTHYLDITGEIDVFEAVLARDGRGPDGRAWRCSRDRASTWCPSDCLAAMLARALPEAIRLELAIKMGGGVSPGTAKTAMESLGAAGRARIGGVIGPVPADRRRRQVTFADGRGHRLRHRLGRRVHRLPLHRDRRHRRLRRAARGGGRHHRRGPDGRPRRPQPLVQGTLKRLVSRLPGPSAKARSEGPVSSGARSPTATAPGSRAPSRPSTATTSPPTPWSASPSWRRAGKVEPGRPHPVTGVRARLRPRARRHRGPRPTHRAG